MRIGTHLPAEDASRIERVFAKFERLGFTDHALAGGLALEAVLAGEGTARAALNDIDVAAASFASVPASLGRGFLVHHVHRARPPGKLMVQLVCPDDAVRIDVFGARGGLLARAGTGRVGARAVRVAAPEDMASRIVSELMGLCRGEAAPAKAARDYRRLVGVVDPAIVETAWRDQRRAVDPETFAEACRAVEAALASGEARLAEAFFRIQPACPRCGDPAPFRLADPERVRSLLGHY